jgi:hypothetical protein
VMCRPDTVYERWVQSLRRMGSHPSAVLADRGGPPFAVDQVNTRRVCPKRLLSRKPFVAPKRLCNNICR